MELIKSQNRWDCGIASIAMLLDIGLEEAKEKIGHDGSEILWPEVEEPQNRKGFPLQELVDFGLKNNLALVEILGNPAIVPYNQPENLKQIFDDYESRFSHYLENYSGILIGENAKHYGHAVVWNHKEAKVYDPNSTICTIEEFALAITSFYLAIKINNQFNLDPLPNDSRTEG